LGESDLDAYMRFAIGNRILWAGNMAVRKNVKSLTSTEKQQFIQAVLALKDNNRTGNKYNQYVKWHADASVMQTPTGSTRSAAHGGPSFGVAELRDE